MATKVEAGSVLSELALDSHVAVHDLADSGMRASVLFGKRTMRCRARSVDISNLDHLLTRQFVTTVPLTEPHSVLAARLLHVGSLRSPRKMPVVDARRITAKVQGGNGIAEWQAVSLSAGNSMNECGSNQIVRSHPAVAIDVSGKGPDDAFIGLDGQSKHEPFSRVGFHDANLTQGGQ